MARFLALLLLLVGIGRAAGAQPLSSEERQLIALINASRAEAGLRPLQPDLRLSEVARGHSVDMATNGFFGHHSPSTGNIRDRLRAASIPARMWGENIALDSSVVAAHQALMNSPGHRANLLNPSFRYVGVGILSNGAQLMVTEALIREGSGFVAQAPSDLPEEAVAAETVYQAPAPYVQPYQEPTTVAHATPVPEPWPMTVPTAEPSVVSSPWAPVAAWTGAWIAGPDGVWHRVGPYAAATPMPMPQWPY